jgi:hypothetical protein
MNFSPNGTSRGDDNAPIGMNASIPTELGKTTALYKPFYCPLKAKKAADKAAFFALRCSQIIKIPYKMLLICIGMIPLTKKQER